MLAISCCESGRSSGESSLQSSRSVNLMSKSMSFFDFDLKVVEGVSLSFIRFPSRSLKEPLTPACLCRSSSFLSLVSLCCISDVPLEASLDLLVDAMQCSN